MPGATPRGLGLYAAMRPVRAKVCSHVSSVYVLLPLQGVGLPFCLLPRALLWAMECPALSGRSQLTLTFPSAVDRWFPSAVDRWFFTRRSRSSLAFRRATKQASQTAKTGSTDTKNGFRAANSSFFTLRSSLSNTFHSQIVFRKVLAFGRQLMSGERGQHVVELQEKQFPGGSKWRR